MLWDVGLHTIYATSPDRRSLHYGHRWLHHKGVTSQSAPSGLPAVSLIVQYLRLNLVHKLHMPLAYLPPDLLEKIHDLDHFCQETLTRLADRSEIPELKFIYEARLAIKIILPHAATLREEIYSQLGFY